MTSLLIRESSYPHIKLRSSIVIAALGAMLGTGCAIHPVQRDVTGVPTLDIVEHIRCETRLAVQDKAIERLRSYGREQASRLADDLSSIRGQPWDFNPDKNLPDPNERAFYDRYIQTGIAYDFTFDIAEDNKATLLADPVRLITNGTFGIGLTGSSEFNRRNSRHFVMSDTFQNLLLHPKKPCADRQPNFAYPIAGSIGMGELISTFIDLNEDKPLAHQSSSSQVFADTLTFTTTLTGSVSPHVEIAPLGHNFGLASPTTAVASGQRLDTHMLIIGLSMTSTAAPRRAAVAAAPAFLGLAHPRSALQKSGGTTGTEQRALDAVTQQRYDTFLDRFGTLPR